MLLALAGCANRLPGTDISLFNDRNSHLPIPLTRWERIYAADLKIRMGKEGAPEVLAIRERGSPERELIQYLTLANDTTTPGENRLILALRLKRDNRSSPAVLETGGDYSFKPAVIERSTQEMLAGAQVSLEPTPRRNRYGTYYYLTASYPGGAQCIYAWQTVRAPDAALAAKAEDAALQLRLCSTTRSRDDLVELFDSIVLTL